MGAFLLTGCGQKDNSQVNVDPVKVDQTTLDTIRILWDEHIDCMMNYYGINFMDFEEGYVYSESDTLAPCSTQRFADYKAFEEYIRNIYSTTLADQLLGNGHYVNQDGKLYFDLKYAANGSYYTDWKDSEIKVTNVSDEKIEFVITGTVEWPAEQPKEEPYPIQGELVAQENGWRLNTLDF